MAGEFVPHFELLTREGGEPPTRWLLVLHGIFGSGKNWRTIARRLVDRRDRWGAALVDLRMHGASQGAPGPHTIAAAAADLAALDAVLAADGKPVEAVMGHSLGGKVALRYAAERARPLSQVWVLDSDPSPKPDAMAGKGLGAVVRVLEMLEALPAEYGDRKAFIEQVVTRGFDRALAQWLAMNLEQAGERLRMRLDPAAMRSLLASFFSADAWPRVDSVAQRSELHFVLGGDSNAVSEASAQRLRTMRVIVHVIEAAGHWLHVDAPDALLDLLARELRAPQPPTA